MSSISSEKNKWVYLMGHNYQKIKFEKYVLESSKVFKEIIRAIEENMEDKWPNHIVIFLPGVELEALVELIKYVANESSTKLEEVNQDLEQLLYKINRIAGVKDQEEVIKNVELPSDEWIGIIDDFIKNEYPELILDIPEKSLPDPKKCNKKYKSNWKTLVQVKQRALGWLKIRIHKNTFIGKFCIFSLINAILPNFEHHSEELTPSLVKYFIKWNEYEFSGIGAQLISAKEDAAIYAISRLLDINLKTYTAPSKKKLFSDIMPKIKLDKVSSKGFEDLYEMSVKLPSSGQVVKCQGNSLFNAKEKTFLLASKLIGLEKKLAVERLNKYVLIEFYNKEAGGKFSTPESPEIVNRTEEAPEMLGSFDPTAIIREALNDYNQNEISFKTEYAPTFLTEEEREQLKKNGLDRMKPYLKKYLFKKLTSEDILLKFLPNATLSVTNSTFCKIIYENLKWSLHSKSRKECKENAINSVLNELFNIKLAPLFFQGQKDLKEKLPVQVLTAQNGKKFTSSLAYQGIIFSISHRDPCEAKKFTVQKALSYAIQKHKDQVQVLNRITFSKYFVNKTSSLVDRVKFILEYFTYQEKIEGRSRFESTDWLLSSFERTLLDEIDNNIHIEPLNDIKFKATVRINNEIVSATNSKPGDAKSSLILRAFKQTEKQKNTFIVVAKPIVVKLEKKDSDDEDVKPILKPGMSSRDIIKFFRKKALDMIYSDRFKIQRKRGFPISPLCILHNTLSPERLKVLQEIEIGPAKYETTIEFVGKAVTGRGVNKREAKQEACRLGFLNILNIDWDRASQGRK